MDTVRENQDPQPIPCSSAFSDVLVVSALFIAFRSCSGFLGSETKLSTLGKAALAENNFNSPV